MENEILIVRGLAGGLLIGVAAALLMLSHGRIAGISNIVGGLVLPRGDNRWRALFIAGLVLAGVLVSQLTPQAYGAPVRPGLLVAVISGLLIGMGTRWGGGCTSGHGVCGLGRLSKRSLVAVLTFIAAGAATVVALRLVGWS